MFEMAPPFAVEGMRITDRPAFCYVSVENYAQSDRYLELQIDVAGTGRGDGGNFLSAAERRTKVTVVVVGRAVGKNCARNKIRFRLQRHRR